MGEDAQRKGRNPVHDSTESRLLSLLNVSRETWKRGVNMIDEIIQLINGVGFPIAASIAMFIMNNKQREEHKSETDKFVEAIQNNTIAITKMIEKVDDMGVK